MAITDADIRRIAELARLRVTDADVRRLTTEIGAIVAHVDVLRQAGTEAVPPGAAGAGRAAMPLREDRVAPPPMRVPAPALAARAEDGFILVPRLATHGDTGTGVASDGADADAADAAARGDEPA